MKTIPLSCFLFLSAFAAQAQLNVSLHGGYTFHTGDHHSKYQDKLISSDGYSNKKNLTYSSAFRLAYLLDHINIGLGVDYGNYQTRMETEITAGLGSFIPSSSFAATTGRYVAPHVFANFYTTIAKKLTIQAGIMTGMLFSGFEKDNGILVIETEPILGGIIPAQELGVEVHTGKVGETSSSNLVSGAQLELGYQINTHLNINAEMAVRRSSVDAHASVLGLDQPFKYNLWYYPLRLGVRYTFHNWFKKKTAPTEMTEGAATGE